MLVDVGQLNALSVTCQHPSGMSFVSRMRGSAVQQMFGVPKLTGDLLC